MNALGSFVNEATVSKFYAIISTFGSVY